MIEKANEKLRKIVDGRKEQMKKSQNQLEKIKPPLYFR